MNGVEHSTPMLHPIQNQPSFIHPTSQLLRSPINLPLKMAALLVAAGMTLSTQAGEVGALARVYSWPDGANNFVTYTKAAGGSITPAAAGNGWQSYASTSFHALAAGGNATLPGTGTQNISYVGGSAYWFEQITISSPSQPFDTGGSGIVTLYFEGDIIAESLGNENRASIAYRVATGDDNKADPNTGDSGEYRVYAGLGYAGTTLSDFRNQPRHHQIFFKYGVPFDFTIAVHCNAEIWRDRRGKVRADLRCTGWNGFHSLIGVNLLPVTDATITSQSGFNYANPGSTTYEQWASLYQLNAASTQADTNNNGLTNLMERALGRNPLAPDTGSPFTSGRMTVGSNEYACFSFKRPRLGARAEDFIYLPQCSNDLSGWSPNGLVTTVAPSTTQTETVTVRSTRPIADQNREFLRLDVIKP